MARQFINDFTGMENGSFLHWKEYDTMEKIFNITADCKPNMHYMVDLTSRLTQMKSYVDKGIYFTINRPRQYGKTTMLRTLKEQLKDGYYVVNMDLQMHMSHAKFRDENRFSVAFAKAFIRIMQKLDAVLSMELKKALERMKMAVQVNEEEFELVELFQYLSDICRVSNRPVVLMVDEVDRAINQPIFLDFLSQLRGYYIDREQSPAFQSVILAGVYDIKNLRSRLSMEDQHRMNSPWNIAVDFKGDMRFSQEEIEGMLKDYEEDHDTGMDTRKMAERIYDHTAGYPFLVSKICKIIDEEIAGSEDFPDEKAAWTYEGFLEADRILLGEKNVLFESMVNKLYDFPELKDMVYSILFTGKEIPYFALNQTIELAELFGFIKNDNGAAVIANRVFEMVFYKLFLKSPENKISVQ
jgi:hypothetical protein